MSNRMVLTFSPMALLVYKVFKHTCTNFIEDERVLVPTNCDLLDMRILR
jgi:hypothetical protein